MWGVPAGAHILGGHSYLWWRPGPRLCPTQDSTPGPLGAMSSPRSSPGSLEVVSVPTVGTGDECMLLGPSGVEAGPGVGGR